MARLPHWIFCLFSILQILATISHAHHHRLHGHLRRTALHDGQGQKPSLAQVDITRQQINEIQAELVDLLSLRDSAGHLLDWESLSQFGKRDGVENSYDSPFLEDLETKIRQLNDMLKALSNLLESFGMQPQPAASSTSTSKGPSSPPARPQISGSAMHSTGQDSFSATPVPTSRINSTNIASPKSSYPAATSSSKSTNPPAVTAASRYSFEPASSSNVAVYFGQTDKTSSVSISTICADPSVDIIVLAFIHRLSTGPTGYPGLNLGAKCWAASSAQTSAGATGLIDCVGDGFSQQVKDCQSAGKKILLSIGGAVGYSETTIASEEDAVRIADNIWNLFGPGGLDGNTTNDIRPFGDLVVDGFDIDNEDHSTLYWPTLISTLREHFLDHPPISNTTSITNKAYYLSAAPQCPHPDASIPRSSMQSHIDYIFVQFYNNPSCNLNSGSDFLSSLQAWSNDLINPPTPFVQTGNGVTGPMVFVGAPAWPDAGSGWVGGEEFLDILDEVPDLELANLGGAMFWDGAYGMLSGNDDRAYGTSGVGMTYMELAKQALT